MILRTLALLLCLAAPAMGEPVRIKDLVSFDGVRGNDLVGYGLVVGLNGTGDGLRNSPFTEEIMSGILERLGVNVSGEQFRPKNVAAVIVTATLPPFARAGSQLDVTVSAIGDAKSLLGGSLVMTPLNAADGEVYAVSQGTILAGGIASGGDDGGEVQGVPTSGTIPNGARVAQMMDAGTIEVRINETGIPSPAHAMAAIENISVEPETVARVVVDQRSGTIVMGADVRISRVAVSQGGLTLTIDNTPVVIQPNPFSEGETIVIPQSTGTISEPTGVALAEVPGGPSLSDVIAGLNALGVKPRDMIDILKTIKEAGALHAELIVR